MIIHDFKTQFNMTIPITKDFIALMKSSFGFYIELRTYFFAHFSAEIQNNSIDNFLKQKVRGKLFDPVFCETLETAKKNFLMEKIKLEGFQEKTQYNLDFLNDLESLNKITDTIYQLLEKHWGLYKYQINSVTSKMIVDFILEIDEIGVEWDAYLGRYLSISKILDIAGGASEKEGFETLMVTFNLPEGKEITLQNLTEFIQFLQMAFDFISFLNKEDSSTKSLEIFNLEVQNPVKAIVFVPESIAASYRKFLHYLSIDVLKKELLLKFVMEVLRLQYSKDVSKQNCTVFHKKLVKQIGQLPSDSYFTVGTTSEPYDSVNIISEFCAEMDTLKIQYKGLFSGFSETLASNRVRPQFEPHLRLEQVQENASESLQTENESKQETKVDIKKKEHIGFLTS